MIKVKRALISVSDKKGLGPFVKGLHALGIEILSTGGTARFIHDVGVPVTEVADFTGSPEILDGRVKTLHPKIHGGILADRENSGHLEEVEKYHIGLIDMVVVNLYPFENVTQKKNVTLEEAIENIDIGGPTMLRAAAKNYKCVATISNPDKYQDVLIELDNNSGILSDSILFRLSVETFKHTAKYDGVISDYLQQRLTRGMDALAETELNSLKSLPKELDLKFEKIQDLRYGENPHQAGAFYAETGHLKGLAKIKQLHGKELSFNNFLDLNAALDFIKDYKEPAAVIIKHNNPTGVAVNKELSVAYKHAWSCDPISAFGGIIGFNKKVDLSTAQLIKKSGFMECIIAPGFEKEALKELKSKKNLRLLTISLKVIGGDLYDFKKVFGGMLLQDNDMRQLSENQMKIVSKKKPNKKQMDAMMFGWSVIKNVRSNAIILVKDTKTVGIGCGQTSRIESVRIAIEKASRESKNAVLVSDAFLPKTDNVEIAAKAGIKAIIQTGGSIADEEVINAADKVNIAMVFTSVRHFKH